MHHGVYDNCVIDYRAVGTSPSNRFEEACFRLKPTVILYRHKVSNFSFQQLLTSLPVSCPLLRRASSSTWYTTSVTQINWHPAIWCSADVYFGKISWFLCVFTTPHDRQYPEIHPRGLGLLLLCCKGICFLCVRWRFFPFVSGTLLFFNGQACIGEEIYSVWKKHWLQNPACSVHSISQDCGCA